MDKNESRLGDISSLSTEDRRGDTHETTNRNQEATGDIRESLGQDVENVYERIASGRDNPYTNDYTETNDDGQISSDHYMENAALLQHEDKYSLPAFEEIANTLQTPDETYPRNVIKTNKNVEIRYTGSSNTEYSEENRVASLERYNNQQLNENAKKLGAAGYYVTVEGVVKCFCCGAELGNWTERHNEWEWHAKSNSLCPHHKKYFDREYLDLKASKKRVFGELQEHLRLKEWLLCKSCGVNFSNKLLFPCKHMCVCEECAKKIRICPSCGIRVKNTINVILESESLC